MESFLTGEPVLDIIIAVVLLLLLKFFLVIFVVILTIWSMFFFLKSLPSFFENVLKDWLLYLIMLK